VQVTLKMLHWFRVVVVCELIWARIASLHFKCQLGIILFYCIWVDSG
jgi:hypothetical protein